jgi:hypothetical protein
MTVLLDAQPVSVPIGNSEVGPLNLPQGTQNLRVTYSCGTWPVVSDGQITVTSGGLAVTAGDTVSCSALTYEAMP